MNPWLELAIRIGLVLGVILTAAAYATWLERRLAAFIQERIGPNRVGPAGLLQPIADVMKLVFKEDIVPRGADKLLFALAPALIMAGAIAAVAVVPFDEGQVIADVDFGLLFLLGIAALGGYSIILGGLAGPSKYSLLGGVRSAAQVVSYELAMGMSLISVVIMAGSLNLSDIVRAQSGLWFIVPGFVAFWVYLASVFAETNRLPFDLPEAESELVGGYHTEYTSLRFAWFFAGEYAHMVIGSCLVTVFFLGGWHGPAPVPGLVWFGLKAFLVLFFIIWVRWTFPRLRYNTLMSLGWKVLLPVAFVNMAATAVLRVLL